MPSWLKPHISFYDKSFFESNTRDYYLSIELSRSSLAIAIFKPDNKKYIIFDSYTFNDSNSFDDLINHFESLLVEKQWLKEKFLKVFLLIDNQYSTLIPPPLFIEEKLNKYLQFNHPVAEGQVSVFNKLNNSNIISVFSLPQVIVDLAKNLWPNVQFFHCSSAIIESLNINFKNKLSNYTLFLNVRDETYDLVYFKNNKLHFYNSFRYNTKEDFIYFLLIAIEELQLNPEEIELILIGNIDKSSILFEMVYRYIRTNKFVERNDGYGYSYLFDGLMGHKNYTLFNVQQCG